MSSKRRKRKSKSQHEVGMLHGFRSGSEVILAEFFELSDIPYEYESEKLEWIEPEKKRKYTPDFKVPKSEGGYMYLECKGRWVTSDRLKMRHIIDQYPSLDIRMVFDNPNCRLSKQSKTTYAQYCEKYGIPYSPLKKAIPVDWLEEIEINK